MRQLKVYFFISPPYEGGDERGGCHRIREAYNLPFNPLVHKEEIRATTQKKLTQKRNI
jgi:hypothetical protein